MFISRKAQKIVPYSAGEQPSRKNIIKLNTNENPFPPSPRVMRSIKKAVNGTLRKYPDPSGGEFRLQAAKYASLDPENIFCGNGSDEVLGIAFQAFFDPGVRVFTPDISYSFYPVWAQLYDLTLEMIPLREDFTIRVSDYFNSEGGVVLANPNAPTGIALLKEDIELIVINNSNKVVIIDEAYVNFGAESVIGLIKKYDNLLVVRTLSKAHSLAGMRIGFAAGNSKLIKAMRCIKNSFNSYPVNRLSEIAAASALQENKYYNAASKKIIENREWIVTELKELEFSILPSDANFIFAKPQNITAETIYNALKYRGIYVRWFNQPRLNPYIRISIGTRQDMRALRDALNEILNYVGNAKLDTFD